MIGVLPRSLCVGGTAYAIRTDFRVALAIFEAMMDSELSDLQKALVCLQSLYFDFSAIPQAQMQDALEQAYWFLDGGDSPKVESDGVRSFDWKQDEGILFPAVNKVAGYETRSCQYLHWWTFLGFFNEIGEGLFSMILHVRQKVQSGKPLEQWEQEIYRTHKNFIHLYTEQERAEIEASEAALKDLVG